MCARAKRLALGIATDEVRRRGKLLEVFRFQQSLAVRRFQQAIRVRPRLVREGVSSLAEYLDVCHVAAAKNGRSLMGRATR